MKTARIFKTGLDGKVNVEAYVGRYPYNNAPYVQMNVADDCPDADDYYPGEPWCTFSINLDGLKRDELAVNHDVICTEPPRFVQEVLQWITGEGTPVPHRHIRSGFIDFPVYRCGKEVLDLMV